MAEVKVVLGALGFGGGEGRMVRGWLGLESGRWGKRGEEEVREEGVVGWMGGGLGIN